MSDEIDYAAPAPHAVTPSELTPEQKLIEQAARNVSRQEQKRMLTIAEQNSRTMARAIFDERDRTLELLKDDLAYERQQKMNALALLEACVRRGGTLNFDRGFIQKECMRGRVRVTAKPDRITVELLDTPELLTTENE